MADELIRVVEQSKPFKLLTPGHYPARTGDTYQQICTESDLGEVMSAVSKSEIVAVDFETKGADYSRYPEHHIVGVGLAWDTGSVYFHITDWESASLNYLFRVLATHRGRIAHNVFFDGGFFLRAFTSLTEYTGYSPWHTCTFALYMQLANEGFLAQKWGLKDAMVDLLGWADTNEHDLDQWLVANGHKMNHGAPKKAEMWRAPAEILGKYCVLDAEATYLLYTNILQPVASKFPALVEYHKEFLEVVSILIRQKISGILVDTKSLRKYCRDLNLQIHNAKVKFLNHPDVAPHVAAYEQDILKRYIDKEPPRNLKRKATTEPIKHKKNGELAQSWINWSEKQKREMPVSKNWQKWSDRYKEILAGNLPEYKFNIRSGDQLRWLLYDRMGNKVTRKTDSGQPAVDNKALKAFGEPGRLLNAFSEIVKEQSYIQGYIDDLEMCGRDTIHPSFKCPGTLTGRLSAKDPNIQQMPKSIGTMSCFVARPGTVWIDLDFTALEPCVTTELSGCPSMMQIFGPTAKPNDIYLFVGAHIRGISEKIRATGYDPYNPNKETLARAKKECKRERSICKTVHLACAYGAYPPKIHSTLTIEGIDISLEEVELIHREYWELFGAVREYADELKREWLSRRGWVLNALGRPMCVDDYVVKDLMNRVVQSSGHDILIKYICVFTRELDRRQIPWRPIIIDLHDASTIEVPVEFQEQAIEVMNWGVAELNRMFADTTTVPLRGEAEAGFTLAEVKKPEH